MSDEFIEIQQGLQDRGISAYQQHPRQLVLSRQRGPVRPDAGNSFWICRLGTDWYICTWAPNYYRVPSSFPLFDVVEAFVDVGKVAQSIISADLIARFGLIETSADKFDRLWEAERSAEYRIRRDL